ncbi:MAG: NUDIX domain-containing protein [Corallococcus sp.]|nr:NUDIX domain-containing protein [Bacillota bacterium]MCM1533682.1 NUDIX domain-containing protein [Corallococcus sp.]
MEILDLYDVNRVKRGDTMTRGGRQPKGSYRLVVHVCIFSTDGKMLCQKRVSSKKVFPDLWDISCGGCVSSGETSQEAAVRETYEELGLILSDDVVPSLTVYFNYGFDDVYCVTKDVDVSDIKFSKEEVADVRWLTKEQIHEMSKQGIFVPYSREYIDYLFYCRDHRGLTDKETPLKGDVEDDE